MATVQVEKKGNELSHLKDTDIAQMKAMGITVEQVRSQIRTFKRGASYLKLNRPCTVGDGIRVIPEDEVRKFSLLHKEAASSGRLLKFVPASGAASRMFKALLQLRKVYQDCDRDKITRNAGQGDGEAEEVLRFMEGIMRFAFFDDIKSAMAASGFDTETELRKGRFKEIIDHLLTSRGIYYTHLPKGLLKFHSYPEGSRTSFEEHLVEAAEYVGDAEGICRLHFTVSPEHQQKFADILEGVGPRYEERYGVRFQVNFSLQKQSTDTIAVDLNNKPFREKDGSLLFRPGGHGALIENLNDLRGDIIYIKNIDNIVPDRLKCPTFKWKKILAGYLIEIQKKVFGYLERLAAEKPEHNFIEEVMDFARNRLYLSPPVDWRWKSSGEKRRFLQNRLKRPLRVCGMVRNEGEPGGGPFWVEGKDGALSLQIVETVQVDPESEEQQTILGSATYFNPVDIVCAVRDNEGKLFDLKGFVDPDAVFISQKSKDGRDLKALELPGLWNGAMANWITVFVEVPINTFNPVKTINDLLRTEHQSL